MHITYPWLLSTERTAMCPTKKLVQESNEHLLDESIVVSPMDDTTLVIDFSSLIFYIFQFSESGWVEWCHYET